MSKITTERGVIVETREYEEGALVIVDHPQAPSDIRNLEVGRIVGGGFQPAPFLAGALSPSTLRAIADLIEEAPNE